MTGAAVLVALAILGVSGCSTNPHLQGVPPEEVQLEQEQDAAEFRRFNEPVELTEAYWDGTTLSVSYLGDGQRYFGYTNAERQQSLAIPLLLFR